MPRVKVIDGQLDFRGGLNTTADEAHLEPNEIRTAVNCRLAEFGGLTKRLGSKRITTAALADKQIRGGTQWVYGSSNVKQVVVCDGKIYLGTYAIPATLAEVTGGTVSNSVLPSFAPFWDGSAEVLYIADGGALNKMTASAVSADIASTPNVTQIAQHNLRLFGIGNTSQPQRLYWSALGNGDTLGITASGGGFADIRTFGQQDLTALLPLGDSLLIFHKRGISVFTGYSQDDIDIDSGTRGLSADVGTIAPRSVVAVENTGFFVSDRGIYSVSLQNGVQSISPKIETTFAGFTQTNFSRIVAAHNPKKREVLFYFPDVGIYAYNYRLGAWTGPWTGVGINTLTPMAMWTAQDATLSPIVLIGNSDGYVRHIDLAATYSDDVTAAGAGGTAVTSSARLHRMFFGDPTMEKSLRYGFLTADVAGTGNIGLNWLSATGSEGSTIGASPAAVWGSFTWGSATWGTASNATHRAHMHGRGVYVDVTLTDDTAGATVFSRVQLQAFAMGRRF